MGLKAIRQYLSRFNGNPCCCFTGPLNQICCGGDVYFISATGNIGVLLADEQEIQTIWSGGYASYSCCGNYFLIVPETGLMKMLPEIRFAATVRLGP
jgi:hypothetical protein